MAIFIFKVAIPIICTMLNVINLTWKRSTASCNSIHEPLKIEHNLFRAFIIKKDLENLIRNEFIVTRKIHNL